MTNDQRPTTNDSPRAHLLISCPDGPGIVAAVSRFLFEAGANIVDAAQHATAPNGGVFFIRIDFELPDLEVRGQQLELDFAAIAERFSMDWRLEYAKRPKRLAILVSREEHCLLELLWQWRAGDVRADIALVMSNHTILQPAVESWGIPFYHVPVPRDGKVEAEQLQQEILEDRADVLVLARYMQILSPEFVARWPQRIINIHHSFLPAFVGSRPYEQAFQRGVKLIGATAHYVTEDLDAGPIIEQDVGRVDHGDSVDDLKRIGRSIERQVLARAVSWHVEDRVLVHENKTVVFS